MPARLSVNINKIATLRNSRGGNVPDLLQVARDCEAYGAEGITVHPRPDERHIRYADVRALKSVVKTEFNIEGNPKEQSFIDLVLQTLPEQVTLVPDAIGQLTSNHGWNTYDEAVFLTEIIKLFKKHDIRVSIFVDPDIRMVEGAAECGTDRIELYTEAYAKGYPVNPSAALDPYVVAATRAAELNLGINAGHDLSLQNLSFFARSIPQLAEVSIGHALISDALYYGLQNTIQMYRRCLTEV